MKLKKSQILLGLTRIALGWLLFWAFFDKLFGLGFATVPEKAWIRGISPCQGFLEFATRGPCSEVFQSLAGLAIVDWIFMLGLLLIGTAMLLGIAQKIAGYSGALLMILMWMAVLPPVHNPIIDEHIIYAMLFLYAANTIEIGEWFGFGKQWKKIRLVKKYTFLQ